MSSFIPLLAVVFQLFLYALQLRSQQDQQCPSDYYCRETRCRPNNISTLQVENLSYVGAESKLTVKVDPNATNGTLNFYYILCAYYARGDEFQLIDCETSGNVYSVLYVWPGAGEVTLTAMIYNTTYDNGSYFSCASTTATIAENFYIGLLDVFVLQQIPISPVSPKIFGNETQRFLAGNVTFVPVTNVTGMNNVTTFKYDFGDQSDIVVDTGPNITHWYKSDGHYSYTVDAFVKIYSDYWAHAQYQDTIIVLEGVANISIAVSKDDSVQVGTTKNITITALGSVPISVCWFVLPAVNATKSTSSNIDPIDMCVSLNFSSTAMYEMDFNVTGKFSFVAVFQNEISAMNGTFNFTVYPAPTPPVVPVVSSTAVAVLAVLIVAVVIIIVIVGFVLPYRRYKRRMTETANFRFVDLSESGSHRWDKFITKVESVAGRFRRRSDDEKRGLVNFDEKSPLNGTHQFSQYEDL